MQGHLADARDGLGGVILIEGPAGQGKSRLLGATAELARDAGLQILVARANELESEFPFGLALQLFEPRWETASPAEQEQLFAGPAALARDLANGRALEMLQPPDAQGYALIHALFWLTSNIVAPPSGGRAPLVLLVDDVEWADASSLRFLNYLAERVGDLPVLLVLALRPGEGVIPDSALRGLRSASEAAVLRPKALSDTGVATVVEEYFPGAEPEFIEACARVTGGNPFLLIELLHKVRADASAPDARTGRQLNRLAPESIVNAIVAHLRTLPESARALAAAVSILRGSSLRVAAGVAELDTTEALEAADLLAKIHMFHDGEPLSFIHPVVCQAVFESLSPLVRGRAHQRAASALHAEGAPPDVVSAHLLSAPPAQDAYAVQTLRAAAQSAMERGAPNTAARLLKRALAERPPAEPRAGALAELAHAGALAGEPDAPDRLAEALTEITQPRQRAELAVLQAKALHAQARHREAAGVLDRAIAELSDEGGELHSELQALYVCAATFVPELQDQVAVRRRGILERGPETLSPSERLAVAHVAAYESSTGGTREQVRRLADIAWGDGVLLDVANAGQLGWHLVMSALLFSDELERGAEIAEQALAAAREDGSPSLYATTSSCRAWQLYEQGRIAAAVADAQEALDETPDNWRMQWRSTYAAIACCCMLRGELEHADRALAIIEGGEVAESTDRHPSLLDARAQLRLAQHRPAQALEEALRAGEELRTLSPRLSPGVIAWRSTAALAHVALGESRLAQEMAAQELEEARRIGLTRVVMRDLRTISFALGDAAGLDMLAEAVELGEGYGTRLEYIHALIDFGAALRRGNRRVDARRPLRKALDLSHRFGATALAERAHAELGAAGGRARTVMQWGIDSLTPSERRVADLGAQGLTTRQMAETLFITPKTVEFHLRHIYQKLNVNSRQELARELNQATEADGTSDPG